MFYSSMNYISRYQCTKPFCSYLSNCVSLRVRFVFKTNSKISPMFPYKNHFCSFDKSLDIKKTMLLIFLMHPLCRSSCFSASLGFPCLAYQDLWAQFLLLILSGRNPNIIKTTNTPSIISDIMVEYIFLIDKIKYLGYPKKFILFYCTY